MYCMHAWEATRTPRGGSLEEGGGGYFVTEEVAMNLLDKEKLVRGSCLKIIDAKMK